MKTDVVGVTKQVWVPQGAGFNSLDPTTDIIIKEGSFAIQKLGTAGVAANPANDTTFFAFTPEPGGAVTTEIEIDYKQYLAGTGLRIWGLGFYYGSIDDYNYLKFFAEDGSLITATTGVLSDGILSGDEIRTGPNGSWTAPGSNLYVNLWFAANDPVFKSFSFSTTRVAFEGDNFAAIFHEVPEPTTMLLFGAGLAGLAGFRRKRSK